jgi:hypothetical protein
MALQEMSPFLPFLPRGCCHSEAAGEESHDKPLNTILANYDNNQLTTIRRLRVKPAMTSLSYLQ